MTDVRIKREANGWIVDATRQPLTVHEDRPYSGEIPMDGFNRPDALESLASALWEAFPQYFGKRGIRLVMPWENDNEVRDRVVYPFALEAVLRDMEACATGVEYVSGASVRRWVGEIRARMDEAEEQAKEMNR